MPDQPTHVSGHHEDSADARRARVAQLLLGAVYLAALSLLVVWEYRDSFEGLSTECQLHDESKSSLYNRPYTKFLQWASADTSGHVVSVAIPGDLEEVQSNVCLGRRYLADVLRTLATQSPAVVVIDKFYSTGACRSDPASTQTLIDAVRSIKVPVIIGESTTGLETMQAESCLQRKPQLDFGSPNVRHGLTRLNREPERFPLTWSVLALPEGRKGHEVALVSAEIKTAAPRVERADSLSLAAVKVYDPAFVARPGIQRLLLEKEHSYANLGVAIPRLTTTDLLCASGDESVRRRWSVTCGAASALPSLMGRIVVIGAENTADIRPVLEKHMWGFELQALYIEALLSGDYLKYLPISAGFALFAIFIFVIEGLPTLLIARVSRWRKRRLICHAYAQRRYLWVSFWTATLILFSAAVCLALRYLPPLLVYGDMLLVAVTRLLFFLLESAEHPFVKAHHHRKAHSHVE